MLDILNKPIELEEVNNAIKELKLGKAAGEDNILNEFLKSAQLPLVTLVSKLFNLYLDYGIYPWNTTLVCPLHKKGCPHNPDNYRAISIGSNLGKLFSSILLQRLLLFRAQYCPDTVNQQGFCKNAQTSDHIFTLNTCIEKYIDKEKTRLFGCFVDFQKAFDTVCRDALLFKLYELGIKGKMFNCITYMYQHSKAKLKMVKKLSKVIEIQAGTEQGHPLSPELFKCYILELSQRLNNIHGINVPILNKAEVSHLLWADDLVILALDKDSMQIMINELNAFCEEWGLLQIANCSYYCGTCTKQCKLTSFVVTSDPRIIVQSETKVDPNSDKLYPSSDVRTRLHLPDFHTMLNIGPPGNYQESSIWPNSST